MNLLGLDPQVKHSLERRQLAVDGGVRDAGLEPLRDVFLDCVGPDPCSFRKRPSGASRLRFLHRPAASPCGR